MKHKKMAIKIELERIFDPKRKSNRMQFQTHAVDFFEDEEKK